MKKIFYTAIAILSVAFSMAQKPVSWSYSAKKISDKVYEVQLKATIQEGWHLYAQEQPESFIGSPTAIRFSKNPLLVLSGKPKEIGELEKTKEPILGIESWQYTNEVNFVQRVTFKNSNVKTIISGNIEFQVCTDDKCLPPATISFSVPVN